MRQLGRKYLRIYIRMASLRCVHVYVFLAQAVIGMSLDINRIELDALPYACVRVPTTVGW